MARTEDGKRIIRKGDFVFREDDNLFVPALWQKREIIAYSRQGYQSKAWQLPTDRNVVKSVGLYQITLEGRVPLNQRIKVSGAGVTLSVNPDEAVSIVPAGMLP